MNERTIDELMDDFNARAKSAGTYDARVFWEVSPNEGSLLDIPETPESQRRMVWLKQQIAELRRDKQQPKEPGTEAVSEQGEP